MKKAAVLIVLLITVSTLSAWDGAVRAYDQNGDAYYWMWPEFYERNAELMDTLINEIEKQNVEIQSLRASNVNAVLLYDEGLRQAYRNNNTISALWLMLGVAFGGLIVMLYRIIKREIN